MTQVATPAPRAQACHGRSPLIAAQAPTGARPSIAPSQKWHSQVKRFRYGIDDERRDGDRRERAHERIELPDREEVDDQRHQAEHDHGGAGEGARRQLASRGAGIGRIDPRVDQAVQRHRKRARSDHRNRDPDQVVRGRNAANGEERADVGERQREDRVLELDEPVVEAGGSHATSAGGRWPGRRAAQRRGRAQAAARRTRHGSRPAIRAG